MSKTILIKKLHPTAVIPKLMTRGAACADLVATEIEYVDENRVTVKYGFATEIPEGYKVLIKPRSSFAHKGWAIVHSPGVIDSDYRGEWMTKFDAIPVGVKEDINDRPLLTYEDFPYKVGDRVTQCSLERVIDFDFVEQDFLSETDRGAGGFGSTGKK